jgi:hypothetical protein
MGCVWGLQFVNVQVDVSDIPEPGFCSRVQRNIPCAPLLAPAFMPGCDDAHNPTVEARSRAFSLSRLEPWRSRVALRDSLSLLLS